MQGVEQEVLFIINQMVEELCVEKLKCNESESEKNFFIPAVQHSDLQNSTADEIFPLRQEIINASDEKLEEAIKSTPSPIDSENHFAENLPENNEKEFHSEDDLQHETTTSMSSTNETDNYRKSPDDSWDETIEEAINKWQKKKFQDAFVQTIFHPPATADCQCQCDFALTDDSLLVLNGDPAEKKIKLDTSENSSLNYKVDWEVENPEMPENTCQKKGNDTKYSFKYKATTHFKSSRIRIGLSRRHKARPLHNDLLI